MSTTFPTLPTLPELGNNPLSDATASPISFLGDAPTTGTPTFSPNTLSNIAGKAASAATNIFGLSIDRWVAIVIGLILIAAGLFLFRPVQEAARSAARAAVVAA